MHKSAQRSLDLSKVHQNHVTTRESKWVWVHLRISYYKDAKMFVKQLRYEGQQMRQSLRRENRDRLQFYVQGWKTGNWRKIVFLDD